MVGDVRQDAGDAAPNASGRSQPEIGLVVVAAGSGRRYGGDKLAAALAGRNVLDLAVAALRRALPTAPVVLVVRPDLDAAARARWQSLGFGVVDGGARRQDSVMHGVAALAVNDATVVVVHDGARPFVPAADIAAVVAAAAKVGAALLVAPVVDTVKRVRSDGMVESTVAREGLARALTPQAFRAGVLRAAYARAGELEWTDEAALVEALGGHVAAVPGDPRNIKVTRPEDLELLRGAFPPVTKVGQGFDVHPFAAGRALFLCGVELTGETGLLGHSDADVALHAVTDAILGAAGAGDIGQHFPPSDERWRGARSELFVRHALALAAARGLRLVHCDLTLLAERPRLSPHRERLCAELARILGLDTDAVGLKATTSEGLGFVGRGEGIVASAIVTMSGS